MAPLAARAVVRQAQRVREELVEYHADLHKPRGVGLGAGSKSTVIGYGDFQPQNIFVC